MKLVENLCQACVRLVNADDVQEQIAKGLYRCAQEHASKGFGFAAPCQFL